MHMYRRQAEFRVHSCHLNVVCVWKVPYIASSKSYSFARGFPNVLRPFSPINSVIYIAPNSSDNPPRIP